MTVEDSIWIICFWPDLKVSNWKSKNLLTKKLANSIKKWLRRNLLNLSMVRTKKVSKVPKLQPFSTIIRSLRILFLLLKKWDRKMFK